MHNSTFELFLYALLGISISSFISNIGFLSVDLNLRLTTDVPYINFQHCFLSNTDIVNFYIMLVDTICLQFSKFGSPTLLYIFTC